MVGLTGSYWNNVYNDLVNLYEMYKEVYGANLNSTTSVA